MNLKTLQSQFSESLLYQHEKIATQIKKTTSLTTEQRLQVYRNSFIMGTTDALSATFPHTLSLVGEDFFNAVSRKFIIDCPPKENNIMTYGGGFDGYLEQLTQLNSMPYISEMAKFEWLMEQTSNLPIAQNKLDIEQLSLIAVDELALLNFQVPTQVTLFQSEQNISQLYRMLITENVVETDLNTPCYLALVKQPDFNIELITLEESEFSLLQQITEQKPLGEITPIDLHRQLPNLLERKLINGFYLKGINND